jgi:hypothetical protein
VWIEVRCCCRPENVLGWLPVAEDVRAGELVSFVASHARWVLPSPTAAPRFEPADRITLTVALYQDGNRRGVALRSEDTPIARLRQIRCFRERVSAA